MALGKGGIRTERQLASAPPGIRSRYPAYEEVSRLLVTGEARSRSEALRRVFGREARSRDYREFRDVAGRGRPQWQRMYRGEAGPVLTPDGIYDAVPESTWRQRSLIGSHWSLMGEERHLTDEQLERKLRPFRHAQIRVYDPQSGRVLRVPFETDGQRFRTFARSPEGRQERVISPKLSPSGLGGTR
jgi:hypothetical protein